jgi:hypothetical protein
MLLRGYTHIICFHFPLGIIAIQMAQTIRVLVYTDVALPVPVRLSKTRYNGHKANETTAMAGIVQIGVLRNTIAGVS